MSTSYVAGLLPRIRRILETSDLSTISAKGVRKELVAKGEIEETVKANRHAIDEKIGEIYEELTAAQNRSPSPASSEDVPLTSQAAPPRSSQPEPLRKKVKTEVKEEPKPVISVEETDEQMALRLQSEFDAMNNTGRASRSAGTTRKKTTKKKKKTGTAKRSSSAMVGDDSDAEAEGKPKKRNRGNDSFNKELILSDALADLVDAPQLSRPQTVKRIWDYVKARNLQDQADKRYILCDDKLRAVFHTDRLHMFTMNKHLGRHLRDPAEVVFKDEKPNGLAVADPVMAQSGAQSVPVYDDEDEESDEE